jgi:hypothetical protein
MGFKPVRHQNDAYASFWIQVPTGIMLLQESMAEKRRDAPDFMQCYMCSVFDDINKQV